MMAVGGCRRKHLCGHRAPGDGGADRQGAVRAARRPLCADLPAGDARARRCRLADLGRSDPQSRRAGRGDAVSADPGRAGRLHRRRRASRAARHPGQGRRPAGGAGARPYRAVRQDRNADGRRRAAAFDRSRAGRNADEVLLLGASLEQASHHVLARAIVAGRARARLAAEDAAQVRETMGSGIARRDRRHGGSAPARAT